MLDIPSPPIPLPGNLTAILRQKNLDRCNLYVDSEFLIGIDVNVLLDFGFKKGDTITESIWQSLWISEQKNKVYDWMLTRLASRMHTAKELKQKALKKGFQSDWIEFALLKIQEKNLIDEQRIAVLLYESKLQVKQWGPNKIRAYLTEKGIAKNHIHHAEELVFHENKRSSEMTLEALIQKKWKSLSKETDFQKKRIKLVRFLLSRGFSYEMIQSKIAHLK